MVVLPLFVLYLLADLQGVSSDSLRMLLLLLVWSGRTARSRSDYGARCGC